METYDRWLNYRRKKLQRKLFYENDDITDLYDLIDYDIKEDIKLSIGDCSTLHIDFDNNRIFLEKEWKE
jgi:hypothetical protein